jgi:pimeloyl-ACP methyl ester carboxylesterase
VSTATLTDAPLAATRGGSGEPLLLIHGIGSSRTTWDRIRPRLEQHFDVIAVDLPGFGDQPWFGGEVAPRMDSLASAAAEELDRLGLDRVWIAGNSMGGWVALELARRGRALGVVAIGPVGGATRDEARKSHRVLVMSWRSCRLFAPAAGAVARFAPLRWAGFQGAVSDPLDVRPEDAANAIRHMAASTGFERLIDDVAGGDDLIERSRERFSTIECPVLIAFGTRDHILDPRGGARLAEAIPGAEHRELVGLGHAPMLDHPEPIADMIIARCSP